MSREDFADFGDEYQRKIVQSLFQDHMFAEQMADVLEAKYFTTKCLQEIVQQFYTYRRKYTGYPSLEVLDAIVRTEDNLSQPLKEQCQEFFKYATHKPLNGDGRFIQDSSLTFCRRQTMGAALGEAIEAVENQDLDSVLSIVRNALVKGASRDVGHEYLQNIDLRKNRSRREPVSTGWDLLDLQFGGGFDRGTIVTFVGGTGCGKSMMLANCAASAIINGLNVAYITLELADWRVGQRIDAYLSEISLNELNEKQEEVKFAIKNKVKGQLYIKEFPTKKASVESIRAYLQRLQAAKNIKIDVLIVDYPDLLKPLRGLEQKRFELESNYEELRGLAQENDMVCLVVDQTNRLGLDVEVVKLEHVAECYNKLMICDAVITIARTIQDKINKTGRIHIAKSRFGDTGAIIPFITDTGTVKIYLRDVNNLDNGAIIEDFKRKNENLMELATESYKNFKSSQKR